MRASPRPDSNLTLLIPAREIKKAVRRLGREISRDYKGRNPLLVGILRGAFVFLSDLFREIRIPVEIDFVRIASYGQSTKSSGEVKILKDLEADVEGRDIIIVEDILDTGETIRCFKNHLGSYGPSSVKVCALARRKVRGREKEDADYLGFEVGPGFLVGYGLDLAERFRNLKSIYIVNEGKMKTS